MKHQRRKKLKTHIPKSPQEWLEYQEHREKWTPEMQKILDQHIRDTFRSTTKQTEQIKKTENTTKSTLH